MTKEFKIERNNLTGGLYSIIEKKGEFFYIDLSYVPFSGIECMAFKCDSNGKVSDWGEVFVDFPREVSELALRSCIEKFLKE